ETDHPKAAPGELPAELFVPMDHLGAEPHDQHERLGIGVAKTLVADVDAVHVGELGGHGGYSSDGISMSLVEFYDMDCGSAEGLATPREPIALLTGPPQRCGMAKNKNSGAGRTQGGTRGPIRRKPQWPTRATIPLPCGRT